MQSQLDAWKGEFGDEYHHRSERLGAAEKRGNLWGHALNLMPRVNMDILEVGAGLGANIEAIRAMYRTIGLRPAMYALEPNKHAAARIVPPVHMIRGEAAAIEADDKSFDLVFTYGVLIHLDDPLPAMQEMYRVSRRFVMCAEYFSPVRRPIPYRQDGQTSLPISLATADYGSLWQDNFDLKLLGYGFCWKPATGLDNVTWWLFEKRDFRLRSMSLGEQTRAIVEAGGQPSHI